MSVKASSSRILSDPINAKYLSATLNYDISKCTFHSRIPVYNEFCYFCLIIAIFRYIYRVWKQIWVVKRKMTLAKENLRIPLYHVILRIINQLHQSFGYSAYQISSICGERTTIIEILVYVRSLKTDSYFISDVRYSILLVSFVNCLHLVATFVKIRGKLEC